MTRIAVAGGAGGVGKTFVEALAKTDHEVVVLSRSARDSPSARLRYIQADYSSVSALTQLLENEKIDTVISALNMLSDATLQAQLHLIEASNASTTTKRFIPSEYGIIANEDSVKIDPYGRYLLASAEALQKTELQYTRVSVGFFMDYWGMPALDSAMAQFHWVLDMEKGFATIPGTGEEKITMTYTRDLARFVVRLLDEEEWPAEAAVVGQDLTLHDAVRWAEEATGKKFSVVYDDREKLLKGQVTPLKDGDESPEHQGMLSAFGLLVTEGHLLLPSSNGYRLNERFPELQALTVEDMIRDSWARK